MLETILTIFCFIGFVGMIAIVWQKIPLISGLPLVLPEEKKDSLSAVIKEKIEKSPPFKKFIPEIFLQKILSKIRVLLLRIEGRVAGRLQKLREKSKRNKEVSEDDYWEELKKLTKNSQDFKL